MVLIRGIPNDQMSHGILKDWWGWQLVDGPDDHWKRLFMLSTHRIIEYPKLKGTNKDYPRSAPGPAQESPRNPTVCSDSALHTAKLEDLRWGCFPCPSFMNIY